MRQLTFILLTGIFAVWSAGCAASVGPPPTPVLLPTLAPLPSPVFIATPTPDQAAIQAQVQQHQIDADLERLRIEATATANAMNLNAQQQTINATVTAQAMILSAQQQEQQRILDATAQAAAQEQQHMAQATEQALQATQQARSDAVQATADARYAEQQLLAQQGQALAAQAQAQRDMYLFMTLAVVALGTIACVGVLVWRRTDLQMAQVHTGHYLPRPTTIIGDGKIVRVHSVPAMATPDEPGVPPNWAVMQATAAANGHLLTFKDGVVTMTDQSGHVIKQRRLSGPKEQTA